MFLQIVSDGEQVRWIVIGIKNFIDQNGYVYTGI